MSISLSRFASALASSHTVNTQATVTSSSATIPPEDTEPSVEPVRPSVPCSASERAILVHSGHNPQASWQRNLFIVPFLTTAGEKVKVVGDYKSGDRLRFEVKNQAGDHYATLKRTQLESGEHVWMLPKNASLLGGAELASGQLPSGEPYAISLLSHEEVEMALENLRNELEELEHFSPPGIDKTHWDFRLNKTNELLDMIQEALPGLDQQKDLVLGYQVDGEIKGLLVLEDKSPPSVYAFVTHPDPAIRGAGQTLMEQAIAISHQRGYKGVLQLLALSDAARDIYQHWGFIIDQQDPTGKRMLRMG